MADPYYADYPGVFTMRLHDSKDDLKRWFDNWKIDKYDYFANDTEWLTIEEAFRTVRGRQISCYTGTIGADHHTTRRAVRFEPGAPPPPSFLQPAVKKWEPPPPEPPGWAERRARAYEFDRMMFRSMLLQSFSPYQRFMADVLPPVAPPPPKYRRNG